MLYSLDEVLDQEKNQVISIYLNFVLKKIVLHVEQEVWVS